jgi:predicted small lipoprotein YifL
VISNYRPKASGWAIILLSVLALGGCGRKGTLDLPPNAAAQSSAAAPLDSDAEAASKPSVFNPYYGTDAPPTAPKGTKKSFILDPLLKSD